MSSETNKKISPYITDQGWSILADHRNLRADLEARNFRAQRGASPAGMPGADESQKLDPWQSVGDRDAVTFDRLSITRNDLPQRSINLQRMIITTDAGIGKSEAVEWLHYRFNRPDTGLLAFQIDAAHLKSNLPEFQVPQHQLNAVLLKWMAGKIQAQSVDLGCTPEDAMALATRHRMSGRLVLLVDGLDHVSTGLPNLVHILDSPFWKDCRFVLAGRPYALQTHFEELKLDSGWEFLRLEEFTPEQQREYLGPKYDSIPKQALPALANVLTIPRVLFYMKHHVSDHQFRLVRTAADVYWLAIRHMVKEAMNGSEDARKLGLPSTHTIPAKVSESQLRQCRNLLAAIAYVMTLGISGRKRLPSGITAPNFERVTEDRMERFRDEVEKRYRTDAEQGLTQDLDALAAMNDFLKRGVFDSDVTGFREVEFRNRSLQEFLTAYYLCTKATKEDGDLWWDRLYLPHDAESDQFYDIWLFVSEMPGTIRPGMDSDSTGPDAPQAIVEEHWLEAIQPLYQTSKGRESFSDLAATDVKTTPSEKDSRPSPPRDARRSCEMIFRTWPQLQRLCDESDPRAIEIRDGWLGEFESILAGQQGEDRQAAAQEFKNDLLLIPAGTFEMGSLRERFRPDTAAWETYFREWLRRALTAPDPQPLVEEVLEQFTAGKQSGHATTSLRNKWATVLQDAIDSRSISPVLNHAFSFDEEPKTRTQVVSDFSIGRSPLINKSYRLFQPQHGLTAELFKWQMNKFSPTPASPTVFISWFDSWVFCLWARWEGSSCRLLWENEWEYTAKFGTDPDANFWWGEDWDPARGVAGDRSMLASVSEPELARANPKLKDIDKRNIGVMDLLGNVWEWCVDEYRVRYERCTFDYSSSPSADRVLRGGCFSVDAFDCRSAYRNYQSGSGIGGAYGVRVARDA